MIKGDLMDKKIEAINACARDCHDAAVKGGWWHESNGLSLIHI